MPKFTTSDGLNLHYEDIGTGQPLLCLAGLTRSSRDFGFLLPHMTDKRVILMDYRGRGESDYDRDFMSYNVLREKRDAVELLAHLGLDRVTLLGTSRGGLIGMAMAASFPHLLSGVILNDIGPIIGPGGLAKIMAYVGKKPRATTYDDAAQDLHTAMEPQFPGVPLTRWRKQAVAQYKEVPGGLDLRYDAHLHNALLEQAAIGATPDLWLFFEALKDIPLGVIRGANSDVLLAETLAQMHDKHPGMISAEVPDRGHVPFLDEPEALDIINSILDQSA